MYLIDTSVLSEARRRSPIAVRWLGATDAALVHRKILVTRNVADFEDTGAGLYNPWAV
ncbi:MAG: hypothetical protein M3Y41_01185 [Pseudomonadota bacterium]|nr:hypothetical protein [Pseudomonadota bacterium]